MLLYPVERLTLPLASTLYFDNVPSARFRFSSFRCSSNTSSCVNSISMSSSVLPVAANPSDPPTLPLPPPLAASVLSSLAPAGRTVESSWEAGMWVCVALPTERACLSPPFVILPGRDGPPLTSSPDENRPKGDEISVLPSVAVGVTAGVEAGAAAALGATTALTPLILLSLPPNTLFRRFWSVRPNPACLWSPLPIAAYLRFLALNCANALRCSKSICAPASFRSTWVWPGQNAVPFLARSVANVVQRCCRGTNALALVHGVNSNGAFVRLTAFEQIEILMSFWRNISVDYLVFVFARCTATESAASCTGSNVAATARSVHLHEKKSITRVTPGRGSFLLCKRSPRWVNA